MNAGRTQRYREISAELIGHLALTLTNVGRADAPYTRLDEVEKFHAAIDKAADDLRRLRSLLPERTPRVLDGCYLEVTLTRAGEIYTAVADDPSTRSVLAESLSAQSNCWVTAVTEIALLHFKLKDAERLDIVTTQDWRNVIVQLRAPTQLANEEGGSDGR